MLVHHGGPPVLLMRQELEGGEKKGPLRTWKGGGNPYAPFCRNREKRRRASRLFRNSVGRMPGEEATAVDAEEEACVENGNGADE